MGAYPVGTRVVAMRDADDNEVHVFGHGVYQGDEIPDNKALGIARICHLSDRTNPKIVLDSGEVVWGGECWWGPEEGFEKFLQGRKIVNVPLPERKELPPKEMFQ